MTAFERAVQAWCTDTTCKAEMDVNLAKVFADILEHTLLQYSIFLEINDYMDTDWRDEQPSSVERFFMEE